MIIIDELTKEVLTDPNLELGEVTSVRIDVAYHYVVEQAAKYEEVIVAEYPDTGGKDVEMRLVSPEIGYWEMLDKEGTVLPYEIELDTAHLPKDENTADIITIGVYHTYTSIELEEIEKQKQEAEKAAKKAQEKQEIMDAIPGRVDEIESAQDDVILLLADIVGGAA